ncbi:MAG TPA: hypothetical protein PKZ76_05740, partial [Xanthomonadaceae bacterium]|nr:hypothetical protein [Xanthomonadaceae bacterium]
ENPLIKPGYAVRTSGASSTPLMILRFDRRALCAEGMARATGRRGELITADHSEILAKAAAEAAMPLLHKPLGPLKLRALLARIRPGRVG